MKKRMANRKSKTFLLAVFILLAALVNSGWQIWSDYRETYRRTETMVRDIALVADAQTHNSVLQAVATLELLADQIIEDKGLRLVNEPRHWKRLHAYCNGLPGCKSIAILDPNGWIVAASDKQKIQPIHAADWPYFQITKKTGKLFIGPAVVSRTLGNPVIFSIARPVVDTTGRLLAIVSAGMDAAHLTEFYGLMGLGVDPTITIFKGNGDIVARYPDMASYVGKNFSNGPLFATQLPKAPSGVYLSVSVLDGKTRIASYKTIKELDLIIFAGIDIDTAFNRWRARAWRTGMTDVVSMLIIFFALYAGYRALVREMSLEIKNVELDRLSHVDALTGIANRRFFDSSLQHAWARHVAENKPLSLLMIDVDSFKQYNDHYGHQAGDNCLCRVAAALKDALHRSGDLVARYGGEEFAVILAADRHGAAAVGERMRCAVQSLALPHALSGAASVVTVSVGIGSMLPHAAGSPQKLMQDADASLYEAKRCGRNRVGAQPMLARRELAAVG